MENYNKLLLRIAKEYSISKGLSETRNEWKTRIIYSLLGEMALASLRDVTEGEEVSVYHVKNRIRDVYESYLEMYPELSVLFPDDPSMLPNEIYDIYLKAGAIYHKPHRILSAARRECSFNGITFLRGCAPEEPKRISGIGSYVISSKTEKDGALEDMFGLSRDTLSDHWMQCIRDAHWTEGGLDAANSYLRTDGKFSYGYWVNHPDKNGKVSLMKTGYQGCELYYLYKYESEALYISQLEGWQTEDFQYRSLANACLAYENSLPPTNYKYNGDLAEISFGYLPPPAELTFWKLYSWPVSYENFPSDFNRICDRKVFEAIKRIMENQGYPFKEE